MYMDDEETRQPESSSHLDVREYGRHFSGVSYSPLQTVPIRDR